MKSTKFKRERARYLTNKWVGHQVDSLWREGYVCHIRQVWIDMQTCYSQLRHPNGNLIQIYEHMTDVEVYKNGKLIQTENFES